MRNKLCWPVDHDDTLTKLNQVPQSEGEASGELLDAGESLDSWVRPASTLLLPLEASKQLEKEKKNLNQHLADGLFHVAADARWARSNYTCCKQSTSVRALWILSICLVLHIVSLMMSPKSL